MIKQTWKRKHYWVWMKKRCYWKCIVLKSNNLNVIKQYWFLLFVMCMAEVKLFARCSLLFIRCSLLFARCSLLFTRCPLLFARCSLVFACCSLLFTRCSTRNPEEFFLSKSKQKVLHINLYNKLNLWITWKLG